MPKPGNYVVVFDDASEAESLQYRTWLENFESDNPPNNMSPDSLQRFRNIVGNIYQNFVFISPREYFEEGSMSKLSERNELCQVGRSGPHVLERTRTSQASVSASASIAISPPTMEWNRSFGNKEARCGAKTARQSKNGRPAQTDDLHLETELELWTPPQPRLASGKRSFPSGDTYPPRDVPLSKRPRCQRVVKSGKAREADELSVEWDDRNSPVGASPR
jgi:hypothetical protein